MLELLKKSLLAAPVVKRGEYNYFVHPISDAIPRITPRLLSEVADAIILHADTEVDAILTMEAMGIHIAAAVSGKTGLPFNIVRKRQYWMPDEVVLDQSTGYGKGKMYINAVEAGERLLIVDAVISTGGTLVAVINALRKIGAQVADVVCVIERGDGVKAVKDATGVGVKTLVKIEVGEKVRIVNAIG